MNNKQSAVSSSILNREKDMDKRKNMDIEIDKNIQKMLRNVKDYKDDMTIIDLNSLNNQLRLLITSQHSDLRNVKRLIKRLSIITKDYLTSISKEVKSFTISDCILNGKWVEMEIKSIVNLRIEEYKALSNSLLACHKSLKEVGQKMKFYEKERRLYLKEDIEKSICDSIKFKDYVDERVLDHVVEFCSSFMERHIYVNRDNQIENFIFRMKNLKSEIRKEGKENEEERMERKERMEGTEGKVSKNKVVESFYKEKTDFGQKFKNSLPHPNKYFEIKNKIEDLELEMEVEKEEENEDEYNDQNYK